METGMKANEKREGMREETECAKKNGNETEMETGR